jgi:hypothetical protein
VRYELFQRTQPQLFTQCDLVYQALTDFHTRHPPDPTVMPTPTPPPAGGASLRSAQAATLTTVPTWPGREPAYVHTIDPAGPPGRRDLEERS